MDSQRTRLIAAALTLLFVLGVAGFVFRDDIQFAWWEYNAARPLSDEQLAKLARCENPGWWGMQRVVLQDLDVDCGPVFVIESMAKHLEKRRVPWAEARFDDRSAPSRVRLRAGLAHHVRYGSSPVELAFLLDDPALPVSFRDGLIDGALSGTPPSDWIDPVWRRRGAVRRFVGGEPGERVAGIRALREHAVWPLQGMDPVIAEAKERVGWNDEALAEWRERRKAGLGLGEAVVAQLPYTAGAGVCAYPPDPHCAKVLADLLIEGPTTAPDSHGGMYEGEPYVAPPLPPLAHELDAYWYARHQNGQAVELGGAALREVADWVRSGEEPAVRMRGFLQPPFVEDGVVPRADPMAVLRREPATPWVTAAVALALAGEDGPTVVVGPYQAGVLVVVDGTPIALGDAVQPPDTGEEAHGAKPGSVLTAEQVLARAAAETFDEVKAIPVREWLARLAFLAARLDPEVGDPLVAQLPELDAASPEAELGHFAGRLFR